MEFVLADAISESVLGRWFVVVAMVGVCFGFVGRVVPRIQTRFRWALFM